MRYRGTFVAESPPPIDLAMQESRGEALAHRTIAAAIAAGIDPAAVAQRILALTGERQASESPQTGKDNQP
jgi:GntR family transcriptional regulator